MKSFKSVNTLFILCLTVVVIVPFSNDIFISAFPVMTKVFNTEHIGMVISVFLTGLALAQPVYGPLSDRFGRKPVLLAGLLIYLLGSTSSLLVHNFHIFLLARFIQAVGACSTIISAIAMLRDTLKGQQLIRSMGVLMAIIGVCPAVAPLLGAVLTNWLGWQGGFIFIWLLGVLYLILIAACFRETNLHKNIHALKWRHIFYNYLSLFKDAAYRNYCIISGLSYGTLFTYFALSSIYIIKLFSFSLLSFGLILFANGIIILFSSLFIPRLAGRIGLPKACLFGTSFLVTGALLMLLCNLIFGANIYTYMLPMSVITLGVGFIRPTASAGAMSQAKKTLAGSAAAGFNFMSFVGGALCSAFGGFLIAAPIYFSIFALFLGLLAVLFACFLRRHGLKRQGASAPSMAASV